MSSLDTKIIGQSRPVINLKKLIPMLAPSTAPVLINGPTGAGKELIAEALHEESRRKGKFIAVNCAAIPAELMEAEVFGYEKGAFTGAVNSSKGKFEQAQNGTIFLDEIGDMPLSLQSKLLRVLENSKITRVGGQKEIQLNLRVVCASHKDLRELCLKGEFRDDLLYRLNTLEISVPTLRERATDIPMLIQHFLKSKAKTIKSDIPSFTDEAYERLKEHDWPGNIRELRNVVERALVFFPKQIIEETDVSEYLLKANSEVINRTFENDTMWETFDKISKNLVEYRPNDEQAAIPSPEDFSRLFDVHNSIDLRSLLRDIEIVLIRAAMNRNDNNTSEAAKDLKLLRTTLIEKTKKYGI